MSKLSRTIIALVDNESMRQLRQNKVMAYVMVCLQDPGEYGYTKIEINSSEETPWSQ